MTPPERIVLVGMMGAGKTTIGTVLSKMTGWPYIDNDQVVEQMVGMPTRDLLKEKGVEAMRAAESAAALQVLARPEPLIAGAAAGIVLDADVSAKVHDGAYVVFLRADLDTLATRVEGTYRPWLGDDPAATMRALYAGREPLYEKLAHLVIDVGDAEPVVFATQILDAWRAAD
jgi:shikimate kinase